MALHVEHVTKSWSDFRLQDIDFTIDEGEYFGVLGPTGSGKTLLLKTIMGFYKPDQGRILLDDQDITDTPVAKRGLGYMPQSYTLFPHLTVRQNIEFGPKMRGMERRQRSERTAEILDLLDLVSLDRRMPHTLSGGEKQKVALARVLVLQPKVVLLDEPLSTLDANTRETLQEELRTVHRALQMTILHVTHDQMEAFSLTKSMAIMRQGRIIQAGNALNLLDNPQNEFIARFLGYENIYDVEQVKSSNGWSEVNLEGVPITLMQELGTGTHKVGIRPDTVMASTTPTVPLSGVWNTLRGTVTDCTPLGSVVLITIDATFAIKSLILRRSFIDMHIRRGDTVWVSFHASSVKVLDECRESG
jgi:ABC-type Fe3+/spermidine/putrescine transport system ATPase subunit